MAIVTTGPYVGFSGTINGMTYYQLKDGRTVVKNKNKKRTKAATPSQEVNQSVMGMISHFMKPFEEIATVGYQNLAKAKGDNTHNMMASHLWKVLESTPNGRKIDLRRFLITQGNLPAARDISVNMTGEGLEFTWNTDVKAKLSHHTDQVILLAYFPTLEEVESKIGGAERRAGKDVLLLNGIEKGHVAEIYISFITNDRSDLSNSIYLGQLNW
ncbi:MAG: DUF6266 family protein [Pedobacter sp.]|uniref:DUF6266 family protein n=1 Tax=Pedobacter sp. TaxID=1411316 RepID=UPI003390FD2E